MRARDVVGLSPRRQAHLVRAMQAGLVLIAVAGLLAGRGSIAVNAGIGLAVTFLPALLERNYGLAMDVALVLWITAAMFLHAFGTVVVPGTSLNVYATVWWWDHLTHTLSASLVAATAYATARAVEVHTEDLVLPPAFVFAYLLLFSMAFGVVWELVEYLTSLGAGLLGVPGILTQYGLADTMLDLVFDTAGALVVAVWGTAYLAGVVGQLAERTGPEAGD